VVSFSCRDRLAILGDVFSYFFLGGLTLRILHGGLSTLTGFLFSVWRGLEIYGIRVGRERRDAFVFYYSAAECI